MGVTAGGAGVIDIKLRLALIGTYCRLLAKHGFHDSACITLSVLTMTAATRGKHQEVLALCKLIQDLLEHRRMSKFAQHGAQGVLLQVLPVIRPMQDVLASGERVHSRARELAPRVQVELIGVAHANNCLCASVPLSSFAHFLDSIEIGRDGFMLAWVAESITFFRRYIRSLIEGRTELPISVDLLSHRENPQLVAIMTIVETQLALLVGDSDRAWDFMREVPDDHELVIGHSWHVPAHAVFSVIALAERWPDGGRRERRKLETVMRKREATARRWAKRCPENYQPMLDIIRGERAALEDRYDDAVTAYELARSVASEQDAHRLVGLSSERLAKLARRRGHTILADGAFDAAREAYEAWGATAVVRRLDRERTAGSPAEDRLVPEGT